MTPQRRIYTLTSGGMGLWRCDQGGASKYERMTLGSCSSLKTLPGPYETNVSGQHWSRLLKNAHKCPSAGRHELPLRPPRSAKMCTPRSKCCTCACGPFPYLHIHVVSGA